MKIALVHNTFSFRHPLTWFSWLIQAFTESLWNHSVIITSIQGVKIVIHAQWVVKVELYEDWLKKTDRRILVSEEMPLSPQSLKWLLRQVHKPYDVRAIGAQLWYRLFGKWIGKEGDQQSKSWFCSELVARLIGLPKSWMYAPSELSECQQIRWKAEYKTYEGFDRLFSTIPQYL